MSFRSIDPPSSDSLPIWEAIYSRYHCIALLIADEIGVFKTLAVTPMDGDELAQQLNISKRAAEVILAVLAAHGHLVKYNGKFQLTASSQEFLNPSSPYYMGAVIEMCRNLPSDHRAIKESLLQDKAAYTTQLDPDKWVDDTSLQQLRNFAASVHAFMFPTAMAVAMKGDFSGVNKFLDVAGGSGCYSIAMATRFPHMDIAIMELPAVCQIIPEYTSQYDLQDKIKLIEADMFKDAWPLGFDAHFFSNIFHDWDAEKCRQLAQKSFAALPSGGKIFLHESLINDNKDGPPVPALYSMNLAVWTPGGKQYSAEELKAILSEAGFEGFSVVAAYSHFSLVSAVKP